MKKCLFVLMVCLMATSAYASNSWAGPTGDWTEAAKWGGGHAPIDADGEIKIIKTSATSLNLTTDAGSFTATKMTISGNGGLTFNIMPGASMRSGKEFCVGCGTAGSGVPTGIVVQTGGTITLNDDAGTGIGKLEIGYKSGSAGVGNGTYTISGGTINGSGGIYVGAFGGTGTGGTSLAIGKLAVSGAGGTISVGGPLMVGVSDAAATPTYTGTGTLAYGIINGGVSAISASSVVLNQGAAGAVANLLVSLTDGSYAGINVVLVSNSDGPVLGYFDNAAWGSTIMLGANAYTLSNVFDVATMTNGSGNDIALIPEPVTIALLGLGFLAIRRKK